MGVAEVLGISEKFMEPLRLVRYSRPGDTFEPHVDWTCDASDPQLELLGQRIATGLLYLTDMPNEAGGETDFPHLGLRVRPKLGELLLWANVGEDGRPLAQTEHEARPLVME